MFYSTYLPVNMNRTECVIYSSDKVFPLGLLLQAHAVVTGTEIEGISFDMGVVTFEDEPDFLWTVPEIFLALEAYNVANENNFSFYVIRSVEGIPQLFVSSQFYGHRILVNAVNMKSILVGQQFLLSKITSLIDKRAEYKYCQDLFDAVSIISKGSSKVLQGLICYKGTEDEVLCVNPLTTLYSDATVYYGLDLIEDLRTVLNDHSANTGSVAFKNNKFVRTDLGEWWPPMNMEHVTSVIELYNKTLDKKSSYTPIVDNDYAPKLYFSVNKRYLVNAETFECVCIKNQHLKDLLAIMAGNRSNSQSEIMLAWMLAKSE